MIGWVIAALIVICLVLAMMCGFLIWCLSEERADIDMLTEKLVSVLERSGDPKKLISAINGYAKRLPPGYPG